MVDVILVGIGGFAGTVARYLIGLIPMQSESVFPWKTFLINVSGAFLIGLICAAAAKDETVNRHLVLMLKVGLCGGFTTFSSFALENANLMKDGMAWVSVLYICLSIFLGVAAVFGAEMIIR